MPLEGTGTFYEHTEGKIVLYVPVAVARDSQFPFEVGDHATIRIDGERLIVEPEEE